MVVDQPPARLKKPEASKVIAPQSLRRNFSWTIVGNVVYAITQWAILTTIVKLGNPELLGEYALALALTAPVFAFSMLQLRGIQATDARNEYMFGQYWALRIMTSGFASIGLVLFAILSRYDRHLKLVIILVVLVKCIDSLSDVLYGLFQKYEQMDMIARAQAINGVVSLAMFVGAMSLTQSLLLGIIGSAFGSLAMLTYYALRAQRLFGGVEPGASKTEMVRLLIPTWDIRSMSTLTVLALPLGVVMMLNSLNTSIPRFVLEASYGKYELGIYAGLAYLLVAGSTVCSALGQSASPRLAKLFAKEESRRFMALLTRLILFGVGIGLAGALLTIVAGRQLLTLIYSAAYADQVNVMVALAISASFTFAASFLGFGMTALREFKSQFGIGVCVTLVGGIASLLLVPPFGLLGAAATLMIGQSIKILLASIVVKRAMLAINE